MQKFKSSLSLKSMALFKKKHTEDVKSDGEEAKKRLSAVSDLRKHNSFIIKRKVDPLISHESLVETPNKKQRTDDANDANEKKLTAELAQKPAVKRPSEHPFGRHIVTDVRKHLSEIRVVVRKDQPIDDGERFECALRGSWLNTEVKIGDVVNVLAKLSEECDAYIIDDTKGLFVVNPDFLMSGTSIVSTLFCMRKSVLNETFKGLEGSSKTMFVGTLVHELLQESIKRRASKTEDISLILRELLRSKSIMNNLIILDMTEDDALREAEPFLPHIVFFLERYVCGMNVSPPSAAFSSQNGGRSVPKPSLWNGKVVSVNDIEENIWSPRLGMKGKVDLTVGVKLHQRDKKGRESKTLPLELKTGRASGSVEHRGQVIMYSMMMSERRDDPEGGLLLYLRNSSLQEVNAGINEMRGLVQLRNELAANLSSQPLIQSDGEVQLPNLPDPINLKRACSSCPHLLGCSLYQKVSNKVPSEPHAMSILVPETLAHLQKQDIEFFNKWNVMTSLENQEIKKNSRLKNLWCKNHVQRENEGSCVHNLLLDHRKKQEDDNFHHFSRTSAIPHTFSSGETVIVSTDKELAIAQGLVLSVTHKDIKLYLDKSLHKRYENDDILFHIDRLEYQGSMSNNYVNLLKLMSPSSEAQRLREFIILKKEPQFLKGLPKEVAVKGKAILRPLNRVQQKAIFKSLMAEDYVLLKGMPGTGKTTMIVALVRLMVALGKSVLLTSYTHNAVDNILEKLTEYPDARFVRLGNKSRIHRKLHPFTADSISENVKDSQALKSLYSGFPVVATTCLGLSHPAVKKRIFDFAILDEAGQIALLSSLGPLFHANKFILVGDPEQLPPVVQNDEAKKMGYDVSLFSSLMKPDNVIPLNIQYRMNSKIMACANALVYNGQLECGSEDVAKRTIPNLKSLDNILVKYPSWMEKIVSSNLEDSVIFLDSPNASELVNAKGVFNEFEANLVKLILKVIENGGLNLNEVGVICPYREQTRMIRDRVHEHIDVSTIDQFQGKDKAVIIFSCTRTKPEKNYFKPNANDILGDMRRLNVAITRARCKLILVGDKETLSAYSTFQKLFQQCDLLQILPIGTDVQDLFSF